MQLQWSVHEILLIVYDYFSMLIDELNGKNINKAAHRRQLIPLLPSRSESSIEFKHQNISAVLINLGQPFIKGYLPRFNYQKILEEKVIEYLKSDIQIENYFKEFSEKEINPIKVDFNKEKFIVDPPKIQISEEPIIRINRRPFKINYLEREQNNQKLGKSGEALVLQYEKWLLQRNGYSKLADKVEWISQSKGDGYGFDILSRNLDGSDKYIEVKTTKLIKETPFFFTINELQFSVENKERYHLYRIFNFDQEPKMFTRNGDFTTICRSVPIAFKGYY
jgi:hypothetical protein